LDSDNSAFRPRRPAVVCLEPPPRRRRQHPRRLAGCSAPRLPRLPRPEVGYSAPRRHPRPPSRPAGPFSAQHRRLRQAAFLLEARPPRRRGWRLRRVLCLAPPARRLPRPRRFPLWAVRCSAPLRRSPPRLRRREALALAVRLWRRRLPRLRLRLRLRHPPAGSALVSISHLPHSAD